MCVKGAEFVGVLDNFANADCAVIDRDGSAALACASIFVTEGAFSS
jgi:hypothetical protein